MFQHMKKEEEKERLVATSSSSDSDDGEASKINKPSRSNAGPTPYHRRSSYFPQNTKQRFKWLIYDNDGSFNGWFDWLPLWMRVGYWSPFVMLSLAFFYTAIFLFKPQPLEFPPTVLRNMDNEGNNDDHYYQFMGMPKETIIDLSIFIWGIVVVIHARLTLGSIGAFPISFTGWSWILLTSRAGLEFMAWVLATHNKNSTLAVKFATIGSSIRLVTITNACVVCTLWNCIFLPLIYFKSIPAGEKRR